MVIIIFHQNVAIDHNKILMKVSLAIAIDEGNRLHSLLMMGTAASEEIL
jgi:hypothetical protein